MYSHIVLGGTFDHLHAGHRDLLTLAFSLAKKVTVGLTKASMNADKILPGEILPYAIREREILEHIQTLGRKNDIRIIPIKDIYGSTLTDKSLDAILVTPHTQSGAVHINTQRVTRGLPELPIEVCVLKLDALGDVLCSSNIRLGKVNRAGQVYQAIFSKDLQVSDIARAAFRRPFGKALGALKARSNPGSLFVVGDVVTQYCIDHAIRFSRAYIDGRSKHIPYLLKSSPGYTVLQSEIQNPAGFVTKQAAELTSESRQTSQEIIHIHGEEDLLTVAAVIMLPFGTRVIYGYPYAPQSMRMITINERIKEKFASLVQR